MSAARSHGGCSDGAGPCTCGGAPRAQAAINGITLHGPGEQPDAEVLRERAWTELLRQEAVRTGCLPRQAVLAAPRLDAAQEEAIQRMLDQAVPERRPSEEECVRYHQAHPRRFVQGRRARVRHILFAVTAGVDVRALAQRAEAALLELTRKDAPPGRFAELARTLSNCPSGADGGELGWVAPEECAGELARVLFDEHGAGLVPRLVHSRHGFHVVEVLAREPGRPLPYDQVRDRIAAELAQRSRATALHQYIRLLAGRALVEGVELEAATSPLLQ